MSLLKRPDMDSQRRFVQVHEMPTDILLELTAYCNMDCIMCPQSSLTRGRGTMSFDLWRKIIDELAVKTPDVKIWPALMGEPFLLGRKLFRYLAYATGKGLTKICLNTNLGIMKREWMDDLFAAGFEDLIISMDGITKETYEGIRVGGNFELLIENINCLLDEKEKRDAKFPRITIQFIVMDENEHEEEAFTQYWQAQSRDIRLKVKPRTGWATAVPSWNGVSDVVQKESRIPCTWLLRQMTVFWDGRVPQCDGDWDLQYPECGDAKVQTIEEIWGGRLKELRQKHMNHDWHHAPCSTCEDWAAGTADFHVFSADTAHGPNHGSGTVDTGGLVQLGLPSASW